MTWLVDLRAISRRGWLIFLLLAVGIPVFITAEYWAFGRLSVFRLYNGNPFFFPELREAAVTGGIPTWSPLMGGGTLTRAQSRETLNLLSQLGRVFGPVVAPNALYLLTLGAGSVSTFVLMRRVVGCSLLFGIASAYIYAVRSFEQLVTSPECAVWLLAPLVLFVFFTLPEQDGFRARLLWVLGLGAIVGFVGDFGRQTVWVLIGLLPIILLYPRTFQWSMLGWWALFGVVAGLFGARVMYTIQAFSPFNDRAYFAKYQYGGSVTAMLTAWLSNVSVLAVFSRSFIAVSALFLALTTYVKDFGLRRWVLRHVIAALGVLIALDLSFWFLVWGFGHTTPTLGSLRIRMEIVLWSYSPLAALLVAGHLPSDFAVIAGKRRVIAISTVIVLAMLALTAREHGSRIKSNIAAWLGNETIGFFLHSEPLRRLRAEDTSLFRVAAVQPAQAEPTNLVPSHLMYYGFETSDSLYSSQIHALRQFWGAVLHRPDFGPSMSLYLAAPVGPEGIDFDKHFSLPLLSLMNTKYFVSRFPVTTNTGLLVPVNTPIDPPDRVSGFSDALRRNLKGADFYIYRNAAVFERAFAVPAIRTFSDERALLGGLSTASTTDLRDAAFVLAREADEIGPLDRRAETRVTIDSYTGATVGMSVATHGPAVLVISNTFGPWWQCQSRARRLKTFPVYHAWLGTRVTSDDTHVTCSIDYASFDLLGAAK